MRLIDADEVQNFLDKESEVCNSGLIRGELKFLKGYVNTILTISPDSLRPKGLWVWNEESECWICSNCELSALNNYRGNSTDSEFCPHCGADMTGDKT